MNLPTLAQQNEALSTTAAEIEKTVKQDNPLKEEPELESTSHSIPMPTPRIEQHKKDIKHYLPTKNVKPLLVGSNDYLTLITEYKTINSKGVAILLPDWQQGATNPKAINFLRKELPQHGWTTVSIQPDSIPENYPSSALTKEEKLKENHSILKNYKEKFGTLINSLIDKANDYPGIVLIIAQGNHGAMVVDLLNKEKKEPVILQSPNALVLLSSYVLTNNIFVDESNKAFAKTIANSDYPILDLYLRHDNPIVVNKAKQRLSMSKQAMKVYFRQRQLNNSAMGYYPETELISQINRWIKSIGW